MSTRPPPAHGRPPSPSPPAVEYAQRVADVTAKNAGRPDVRDERGRRIINAADALSAITPGRRPRVDNGL